MKDLHEYLMRTINEADEAFIQELFGTFDKAFIDFLNELITFVDRKSGNIQWSSDWTVKNEPDNAFWTPWDKGAKEFFKGIFSTLKDSVGSVTRPDVFNSKHVARPWQVSWGGQYAIMNMSEFNKLWKQYIKSQGKLGDDIIDHCNYNGGEHITWQVSGVIDKIISECGGRDIKSMPISTGNVDATMIISNGAIGRGVEGFVCSVRDIKYRPNAATKQTVSTDTTDATGRTVITVGDVIAYAQAKSKGIQIGTVEKAGARIIVQGNTVLPTQCVVLYHDGKSVVFDTSIVR